MTIHRIEVRQPGQPPRQVQIEGSLEVGRETEGLVLDDPKVSRRHLRLTAGPLGLTVADLGSTNGTRVNGEDVRDERGLNAGDTIRLGAVELVVLSPADAEPPPTGPPPSTVAPAGDQPVTSAGSALSAEAATAQPPDVSPAPSTPSSPASEPAPPALPAQRPVLDELAARETEEAVVRFRPGSSGEAAAPGVAAAVRVARRQLKGLGSEPWGVRPQVCLIDPFPDPERPGEIVASGTVVDAERGEIWMVVTSESPPEPPARPLALLFGAALPAAGDLTLLLEGYGMHVAGSPDPDPQLREIDLPPLDSADGELATAMSLSFVRHLVRQRGGVETFRRLLAEARPGRVDATAQDLYGMPLAALEEDWRQALAAGAAAPPKTGQFLRLSARYLRPHVRREVEMFLYALLGLAFTVVFPFGFRRLLDRAIPSGRMSEVLAIVGLLAGAFVLSLVANLRRAYLSAYVSGAVVLQVRTDMFARLQGLSMGWFNRRQQGDVLSRLFTDVAVVERGLSETLREGLVQLLSLVVSAVVLILLNPLLAIVSLVGAPLVGLVYKSMATGAQKRSVAVQEQTGSVFAVASENYGAQPVVKAFGLEARERARFGRASERLFKSQIRLHLFSGLFGLSVNMIVTALRLVVLGLGAWLILEGRLTVGGLVAFIGVMGEVLSPVTVLTGIGEQIQASTGALVRVNEVLEAAPDVADAPDAVTLPPLSKEIRLDAVSFSYTPERRTLEALDVVIPAGARVAFVGPTGAGKSSVLQLLMRFYDPDEGAVRFDGRDLRSATVPSLRGQLGVVFQDTFVYNTTIRENIELGRPGASHADVEAAAKGAELHDFITALPRGYDTLVGERGGRLSGGQRQRLAIARALVRDPRVLLLDEATSALDPRTERMITATLQQVGEGRTTIAVTHRLSSIVGYDRIFVLADGKVAEQGTHDELVRRGGVYAALWSEQAGGEVTAEAPFDASAALRRIPLFADLGPADLGLVAGRLRAVDLKSGDTVREASGHLLIIRAGRGRVMVPGVGGTPVPLTEIGPGDAFGVSAVLGAETGAVLEALEPVKALHLDDAALAALTATIPAVAAVREGRPPTVRPAGGRRLSRSTMPPPDGAPTLAPAPPPVDAPDAGDVRRASGSFTRVR